MKKLSFVVVAALLMVAASMQPASGQYANRVYERPVNVHYGADSLYNGSQPDSCATYKSRAIYIAKHGTAYTNWLRISDLAVPAFVESYRDTQRVVNTITRTETRAEATPAYRDTVISEPWIWGVPGTTIKSGLQTYSGRDTLINNVWIWGDPTVEALTQTDTYAGQDTVTIGERVFGGWTDSTGGFALNDSLITYGHTVSKTATISKGHTAVVDSLIGYAHTIAYADTITGAYVVPVDSLIGHPAVTRTQTIVWAESWATAPLDQPAGFKLGLAATGALDSLYVSAQVSMDGVGYKVIQRSLLAASKGTTATALTSGREMMEIPAGKLIGWNYVRFQINNYDRSHNKAVAVTPHHWYCTYQGMPDWGEAR